MINFDNTKTYLIVWQVTSLDHLNKMEIFVVRKNTVWVLLDIIKDYSPK